MRHLRALHLTHHNGLFGADGVRDGTPSGECPGNGGSSPRSSRRSATRPGKTFAAGTTSRCERASLNTWRGSGLSIPIRADGTFRAQLVSTEDRNDTLTIIGEFTGPRRARGTVRAVEEGGDCDGAVKATWKVTKQ